MELIIGFFVLIFIYSFAKQTRKENKKFEYKERKEYIIFPLNENRFEEQDLKDGSEQEFEQNHFED